MHEPNAAEEARRQEVMAAIIDCVARCQPVKLPPFDPGAGSAIGAEPNPFNGQCGDLAYQFEGEEDLLHLIVTRIDGEPCPLGLAQDLASWLLEGVPRSLIWFKPSPLAQHFYVGHDDLPSVHHKNQ